jgi:hypothetical protein
LLLDGKILAGRTRHRWEHGIKINLKETGRKCDCIPMVLHTVHLQQEFLLVKSKGFSISLHNIPY